MCALEPTAGVGSARVQILKTGGIGGSIRVNSHLAIEFVFNSKDRGDMTDTQAGGQTHFLVDERKRESTNMNFTSNNNVSPFPYPMQGACYLHKVNRSAFTASCTRDPSRLPPLSSLFLAVLFLFLTAVRRDENPFISLYACLTCEHALFHALHART